MRNKITIELNDDDLDHIRHMSEGEATVYTLGHAVIVVLKKERENGKGL